MRHLLLGVGAVPGLLALTVAATAAPSLPPSATATGAVAALGPNRIAVHGRHRLACRVDPGSPGLIRGLRLGSEVKIVCARGVLRAIVRLGGGTNSASSSTSTVSSSAVSSSSSVSSSSGSASSSTSTTSSGTTKTSASLAVTTGPIAAVGNGSIAVGPVKCSVGPSSPATSGLRVGDRVQIRCEDGTLASLTRENA